VAEATPVTTHRAQVQSYTALVFFILLPTKEMIDGYCGPE
jgi:hypothetical protein